jgi:rod shape-determining protein MreD
MLKNIWFYVFFIFFILIMETVFFYQFNLKFYSPDLFLIFIIYIGCFKGSFKGQTLGFVVGIIKDIFSMSVFGTNAFIFTIIGYLAGNISINLDRKKIFIKMFLTFIFSYIYILLFYVVQFVFGNKFKINYNPLILIKPFINILFVPVCFFVFKKFDKSSNNNVAE